MIYYNYKRDNYYINYLTIDQVVIDSAKNVERHYAAIVPSIKV